MAHIRCLFYNNRSFPHSCAYITKSRNNVLQQIMFSGKLRSLGLEGDVSDQTRHKTGCTARKGDKGQGA